MTNNSVSLLELSNMWHKHKGSNIPLGRGHCSRLEGTPCAVGTSPEPRVSTVPL